MKVTYVYHSCFVIEFENVVFVFDYFQGEIPAFDKSKEVIFFASHKHHDHFSMEIFKAIEKYDKVTFVLSSDISLSCNYMLRHGYGEGIMSHIIKVGKNQSVTLTVANKELKVETLTSTDQGVAFLLQYEDKTIYHAGDLNWWAWPGETKEYNIDMELKYKHEINKLKDKEINIAMVVLDPRQEELYWQGFDYFMRTTNTLQVFPMHCWEDYRIIDSMVQRRESESYRNQMIIITEEGQTFDC